MPYYNTCQNCGATLDPNEVCDCQRKETKMYICEKCNKLYEEDEIPTHIEHHPYGNGTAEEVVADYGCCGQGLEEAVQCDRCGEWYAISSDDIFGNAHTVCKNCYTEMYSTDKIVKIAQKEDQKSSVKINELLAYVFEPDEIEEILYKELHALCNFYKLLCPDSLQRIAA